MKQVQYHELGEPDVLVLEDVADPTPGPDEITVRMIAAGVNFSDAGKRRGLYLEPTPLPYVPGSEAVGTVEALGEAVTGLFVGQRVVGLLPSRSGGYSEIVVMPAISAVPVPDALDSAIAVALPNQGATALHLLTTMARLQPGESVLVHAAAGGVGGLAIQLARHLGAGDIIALASQKAKREHALALGATVALDSTNFDWAAQVREATAGRGVDVALDSIGGDAFEATLDSLAPFGRIVCYGLASGKPNQVMPLRLMRGSQAVMGFHLDTIVQDPLRFRGDVDRLLELARTGELKPTIGESFALRDAAAAHRAIESRGSIGKLIMTP